MPTNRDARDGEARGSEYEVGFGKPPKSTRFRKGQSGNPSGRPRDAKNFATILDEELEQEVIVRENGRQKTISKLRASIKQLVNKAASGDHRAIKALFDIRSDLEKRPTQPAGEPEQLDDSDREVIAGILDRLRQSTESTGEKGGSNDGGAETES